MHQPTLFTIRCSRCKQHLPDEQFMPSVQRKRAGYCRPCQAAYMREYKTGQCLVCSAPIDKQHMRCRRCAAAGRRRVRRASLDRSPSPSPLRINPKTGRPAYTNAWKQLRQSVLNEETHCGICGEVVDKTLPGIDPRGPSLDHIIPLIHGGHPFDRANLRLAHHGCNASEGASTRVVMERERVRFAQFALVMARLGM